MIVIEKRMILTHLQKLPNNVGNLGKIFVATGFEWLPKVQNSPNLVTLYIIISEQILGNVNAPIATDQCFTILVKIAFSH